MLLGHIAISTLLNRYLKTDVIPTQVGGIFPDLVDKTLCQGLGITPSGRMAAHTLLGLASSTAIVGLIWGKRAAKGWGAGYLGHLLADSDGFVPWLYPFQAYKFRPSRPLNLRIILHRFFVRPGKLEVLLAAWATWQILRKYSGGAS